jgi:pyrroline-5-carboxylate reductase
MGEALARGLLAAGALDASDLCASVRTEERRQALAALLGPSQVHGDALDGGAQKVAERSDVVVVGVKPDAVGEVLDALAPHLDVSRHLVVSIAAGVTLDAMARRLPKGARIARVMPNTPTLVGAGASVFCLNEEASSSDNSDSATVRAMLGAVGLALPLDEILMDAATGLSGCGPAYVFLMIEALSDGGVKAGLQRDAATRLAAATVGGAAQMVLEAGPGRGEGRARSDEGDDEHTNLREMAHPAVLRERVCSPGGATIAGVAVLEDAGVRGAVARAVGAAAKRAAELASK